MTTRTRNVVWLLAAGFAISVLAAVKFARDRRQLASAYSQAQASLAELNAQYAAAQAVAAGQAEQLTDLHVELARIHSELDALQSEVAVLHAANHSLQQQLALTTQEKDALQAKFASIKELKLALRDVRAKMWRERWQGMLARFQQWRPAARLARHDDVDFGQGNRGFVVREGVPTLGSVTKLQVRVLEPQPQ
ncbi:MAG: hypothetical protein HYY15_04520 [Candidatus Omnitrophica bacterium]|nr:hypothetical protein [Candidatus Omnitrophota bacterium]